MNLLDRSELYNEKNSAFIIANHYFSIPQITKQAEILALSALFSSCNGLLTVAGSPLIKPFVKLCGEYVDFSKMKSAYNYGCVPYFIIETDDITIAIDILLTENKQGFTYSIKITNKTSNTIPVTVGLKGLLQSLIYNVSEAYRLDHMENIFIHNKTKSIVASMSSFHGNFCMAICDEQQTAHMQVNGSEYSMEKVVMASANSTRQIYFHIAIAANPDTAALKALDLSIYKGSVIEQQFLSTISKRYISLADEQCETLANINLNAAYYLSAAYSIDTNSLTLLGSSSYKHDSCLYFSARNLLSIFPIYLRINPQFAKKVLMLFFDKYIDSIESSLKDINALPVIDSVCIDELCTPFMLVELYYLATKDRSVLDDPLIISKLKEVLKKIDKLYDPNVELYHSQIDASSCIPQYKFLTFSNVLLWKIFKFCGSLGIADKSMATNLFAAITRNCTFPVDGSNMYVYSIDGKGKFEIYDCPDGSLFSLPSYGFCVNKFSFYQNTLDYLISPSYEYFVDCDPIIGLGNKSSNSPMLSSLCSVLLSNPLQFSFMNTIRNIKFFGGVASKTYNAFNGVSDSGFDDPKAAGQLVMALLKIYGQ